VTDRRDHAEPEFHDFDDEAIDLALVHADDEYLDLLGGARLDDRDAFLGEFGDERLTELLMSWREDVDAEPIGDLVDTRLATVTVHAATMSRKRRPRLLVPLAAAAAVLAIMFAGFGLAARDAQPGDTLWALSKVLYAERARSVEAAETVKQDLAQAKAALTEGKVDVAKSKLEEAHEALPTVSSDDGRDELEAQHASLVAQLPGAPSGEAVPPPHPTPSEQPNPGSGSSGGDGSSTNSSPTAPQDPPSQTQPPQEAPPGSSTPPTTTEPSREEPPTSSTNGGTSGGTQGSTEGGEQTGGTGSGEPAGEAAAEEAAPAAAG
jgi:hypothetical protein